MREELLDKAAEESLQTRPYGYLRPEDKIVYKDGFKDGYKLGLKAKINMTTISDAPALPEADEDYKISIAKEAWDAVNTCTPYHPESFVQGYIAGAGPRDKQNAELKADNDARKFAMAMSEKVEKQLREKNEELEADIERRKNQGLDNINKYTRLAESDRRTIADCRAEIERTRIGALNNLDGWRKSDAKLTKAREIITNLIDCLNHDDGTPENNCIIAQHISKAEEFLKEAHHD